MESVVSIVITEDVGLLHIIIVKISTNIVIACFDHIKQPHIFGPNFKLFFLNKEETVSLLSQKHTRYSLF